MVDGRFTSIHFIFVLTITTNHIAAGGICERVISELLAQTQPELATGFKSTLCRLATVVIYLFKVVFLQIRKETGNKA